MYKYCMRKCCQCPGCALYNPVVKINELVYKFPINAPFNVLHVDGYKAGAHFNLGGASCTDWTMVLRCESALIAPALPWS